MAGLIIIGVPVGAVILAGLCLHFFDSAWVIRISNGAIGTQLALTLLAWLLLATLPGRQNWHERKGSTCPILDGLQGHVVAGIAFASVAVGAVALASSFISVRRRAAKQGRLLAGILAAAAPVAIFAPFVGAAFCGFN